MKKTIILTILLLGTVLVSGFGQSRTVTGRVYDSSDGTNLAGAMVIVMGPDGPVTGSATGVDGKFSITWRGEGALLQASYIGYDNVDVPLEAGTDYYDIPIGATVNIVEDVVVVGYGVQRKESVVGAITQISGTELARSTTPNLTNALAGRTAGVITVMGSGNPGEDNTEVYVRGNVSPNGHDPLVIVDGLERDWKEIDATDIQTMSVLKDASATAVYGVRGGNGVILITTKRGQVGKPSLKVSYQASVQQPIRIPEYLRSYDFALLQNEARRNDPGQSEAYTAADLEHYRLGDSPYTHPDNDYYNDLLSKTAMQHQANATVSGGTEFVKYFISGNFMTQEGLYREFKNDKYPTNNRYTRAAIRANLDFNITKTTRLGVDVTGRIETRSQPNNNSAIFDRIQKTPPNWQPYVNPDGSVNNYTRDMFNPTLMMSRLGYRWQYTNVLETVFRFEQKLDFITKGLSLSALYGLNSRYRSGRTISEEPLAYSYNKNGVYGGDIQRVETSYSVSKGGSWKNTTGNVQLNYARDFGKHSVSAMFVYNVDQKWGDNKDDAGEFAPPLSYNGLAVRATYDFANRYLFEFNLGYNGSTHFAKDRRYDYFPAFSLGWVPSEERFWKDNIRAIDFLKIRGSWGLVGNDDFSDSDYDYYYTQTYYQKAGGDGDGSLYWGYPGSTTTQKFLVEGTLGNDKVTWEKGAKMNVGLDLRMFGSKLTFTFDYFYEDRYDILGLPYNVPLVLGMGNPTEANRGLPPANINRVKNRGVDIELGYNGRVRDFTYYMKGNFTLARNSYAIINEENVVYQWQSKKGRPIGQLFGLTDIGLYQNSDFETDAQGNLVLENNYPILKEGLPVPQYGAVWPGDCKYSDLNSDGVVDQYDRGAIGKSKIPEYTYGITIGGEWKGIDFNVLFQGAGGANMFLREFAIWEFYSSSGDNGKVMRHHLGRYNPDDPATWNTATYPRLHYGLNNNNHQNTTRWMFDRSYLRLKNVEIGYTLPSKWMSKIKVASCRVYASGNNIYTWDHMMNWDPESSSETGSAYPQIRSWSFGVNIQF